jgi:hypothetical protein
MAGNVYQQINHMINQSSDSLVMKKKNILRENLDAIREFVVD